MLLSTRHTLVFGQKHSSNSRGVVTLSHGSRGGWLLDEQSLRLVAGCRLKPEEQTGQLYSDPEVGSARLTPELARIAEERSALNKFRGVPRQDIRVKCAFIKAHRDEFRLSPCAGY